MLGGCCRLDGKAGCCLQSSSLLQGLEGLQEMMKSPATETRPCDQHQGARRERAAEMGINVPRSHREERADSRPFNLMFT